MVASGALQLALFGPPTPSVAIATGGAAPPPAPPGVRARLALDETPPFGDAGTDAPRGAAGVLDQSTNNCNGPKNAGSDPARVDVLLRAWRAERRAKHLRAVAVAEACEDATRAAWHGSRANSLLRPFSERADECGKDPGAVVCHCMGCGTVHAFQRGCALRSWCGGCARKWAAGYEKRLSAALGWAERVALKRWNVAGRRKGKRPALQLLTLTVRSTGDVERDRETIAQAWPRLRAWWFRRIGAPAYALTYEVTAGTEGQGHAHAHLAILLPFLDITAVQAEWSKLTDGHVDLATKRAKSGAGRAASCARYIAKYASKGSRIDALPDDVAAAWVRATHARRQVSTSRALFATTDGPGVSPCCGERLYYQGFRHDAPKCVDTSDACHDRSGGPDI